MKMTQTQQIIEDLYDCYTRTAVNIISYYGGNERKDKLEELKDIVKNNCITEKKLDSIDSVKRKLLREHYNEDDDTEVDIDGITQQYKNAISEISVDVSKEAKLIEFNNQIKDILGKEGDEEDNEDAELQLTGGCINVIDPISKKRIIDPVKNILCGHTYDRDSITQILKINKKTRCPVIGCKSIEFVTLTHLRKDIVTMTYLEKNPV